MKLLLLLLGLCAVLARAQLFADLADNLHMERLGHPYTYQRLGYDMQHMAYDMRYPNAKNYYKDDFKPSSWSDIFGPGFYKGGK